MSKHQKLVEELANIVKNSQHGLSAAEIAAVNPELLKSPLDELEDNGSICGSYEQRGDHWVYVYRWCAEK